MTDAQRKYIREYMRKWRANNKQRNRLLNAEAKKRYMVRLYLESMTKGEPASNGKEE